MIGSNRGTSTVASLSTIEGMVIFAQESRFQLLDCRGVGHLFVLSHTCAADPEQLPLMQRDQARVRVRYRPVEGLLACAAMRIDRLDA